MSNQPHSISGLQMPPDFDVVAHEGVSSNLTGSSKIHSDKHREFVLAWRAVAYRFRSCTEYHEAFSAITTNSSEYKYKQERELFGFFTTGLATVESFCYALFAIASLVQPNEFPLDTNEDKQSIYPEKVADKFGAYFSGEKVSKKLRRLVGSQEYKVWKDIRNILSHRLVPPRKLFGSVSIGGNKKPPQPLPDAWDWGNQPLLDANFTADKLAWLTKVMETLLIETELFTAKHVT